MNWIVEEKESEVEKLNPEIMDGKNLHYLSEHGEWNRRWKLKKTYIKKRIIYKVMPEK